MLSWCLLSSHSSTRHELLVWTCGRLLVTLCVPAVPTELTKPWFRSGGGRRVAVEASTSSAIDRSLTEASRTMSNYSGLAGEVFGWVQPEVILDQGFPRP